MCAGNAVQLYGPQSMCIFLWFLFERRPSSYLGDGDVYAELIKLPKAIQSDWIAAWEAHKRDTRYDFYIDRVPSYTHFVCERAIRKLQKAFETTSEIKNL